jgi:transposase
MELRKRSWLSRREKVELFEQIRREYCFGVGTIAGVSRKLGVHRRMVREALRSAEPASPKPQQRRLRKLDAVTGFIDRILQADMSAPPKQRHTARRIFDRLCAEVPDFSGRERSVRGYVQRRRQQLGLEHREVFVAQSYEWGSEAQVDWYEAWAVLSGERVKLQVFEMRSMASGGAYHRAYLHATQQAFLEAHQFAFAYFSGVFRTLRYDNLKSAVKKVLRGYRREETSRFIAFRSHWRFQSEFCNPARGNEKGGVEGEGGYFRRNHWVPLPEARDLDELNTYLERCCREDQSRVLSGRSDIVGAAMLIEQAHLLQLPARSYSNWPRSASPQWTDCAVCACGRTATQFRCDLGSRSKLACMLILSSCGMKASASHAMNAVTVASNRSWISNTIWMCWSASPVHWPVQRRWRSGARQGAGLSPSTCCGMR